jgi:Ring finger domain
MSLSAQPPTRDSDLTSPPVSLQASPSPARSTTVPSEVDDSTARPSSDETPPSHAPALESSAREAAADDARQATTGDAQQAATGNAQQAPTGDARPPADEDSLDANAEDPLTATLDSSKLYRALSLRQDANRSPVVDRLGELKILLARYGADAVAGTIVSYFVVNREIVTSSPLFVAILMNNVEAVVFLVDECNADINIGASYSSQVPGYVHHVTPLSIAATSGNTAAVRFLVDRGASLGSGIPQGPSESARVSSEDAVVSVAPSQSAADPDRKQSQGQEPVYGQAQRSAKSGRSLTVNRYMSWSPGAIEHALCHDTSHRSEVDNLGYVNPLWVLRGADMVCVMEILLSSPSVRKDWSSVTDPVLLAECPLLLAARHPLLLGVLEHCLMNGFTLGPETIDRVNIEACSWGNVSAVHSMLARGANVRYRSQGSVGLGDVRSGGAPLSTSVGGTGASRGSMDGLCFTADAHPSGSTSSKKKKSNDGTQQQQKQQKQQQRTTSVAAFAASSARPVARNHYTPLLAACAHLRAMDVFANRYSTVVAQAGYDPIDVVMLLVQNGASVSARDGRGRTSLWHVASCVDGENVDHPPEWDRTGQMSTRSLRETCFRLYSILQSFGAVGYMGPGAPSSMLLNSSSIDTDDEEGIGGSWNDSTYGVGHVDSCAICLEPLDTSPIERQDDCNHVHHVICIEQWKEKRDVCPQCCANDSAQQQMMTSSY